MQNQLIVAYDYAYDPAHRLKTVTDSRGGKQISYTWTPGGRLAQVRDSDGHVASYAYDAVGRLASITAPNNETIALTWDAGGRLVEQRLASGLRTTLSWFEDGSLKEKKNLYGASTLSDHLYTLDVQGRHATQSENIAGSTKSWSYLYDNLDRLTSASDGTAETYGYDIWGNRRSKTKSGVTTAYLYDAAHQLSEIRSGSDTGALIGAALHDADGHMVKLCEGATVTKTVSDCSATGTGATALALTWNALDQLLTATRSGAGAVAESYGYDDSGRRIRKTSGSATTQYLYDGEDIHAEWATAISGMPSAEYVQGAGTDEPILRLTGTTNSPSATQAAYVQDGLGSVIAMANASGTLTANQRFDAWGNKTASTGTVNQYGYTGREPDATGLVYYRARYYVPGIGRFASRDPAGLGAGINRYAYVNGNPVSLADPYGLMAASPVATQFAQANTSYTGNATSSVNLTSRDVLGSYAAGAGNLLAQGGANLLYGLGQVVSLGDLGNMTDGPPQVQPFSSTSKYFASQGAATAAGLSAVTGATGLGNLGATFAEVSAVSRVQQIHQILDPIAQDMRTTAALTTNEGKTVFAGGARDLTPAQRASLGQGEIAASLPGQHAEVTAIQHAQQSGLTPSNLSIYGGQQGTRVICPGCRSFIEQSGGTVTSPTTAIWPH